MDSALGLEVNANYAVRVKSAVRHVVTREEFVRLVGGQPESLFTRHWVGLSSNGSHMSGLNVVSGLLSRNMGWVSAVQLSSFFVQIESLSRVGLERRGLVAHFAGDTWMK